MRSRGGATLALGCVAIAAAQLVSCSSSTLPSAGPSTTVTPSAVGSLPSWRPGAPTSGLKAAPVLSDAENATTVISRDIGITVALPNGLELWLFGDTSIYGRSGGAWTLSNFVDGSTAFAAHYKRGQVPHGSEYPSATPTRFLPVPNGVYMADGSGRPCIKGNGDAAFPARWPNGATVMPTDHSDVLITYSIVCVFGQSTNPQDVTEGWGYALYNWRTSRFDRGPVDVVTPRINGGAIADLSVWRSPIFHDGELTVFASTCPKRFLGCIHGQVSSVTLPATTAALDHVMSYPVRKLSTDSSGVWEPQSISVGRYSTGLRLIEGTTIAGTYAILSASTVDGPWHIDWSGKLPGCPPRFGYCFALEGHPELSTPTDVVVSYVDPDIGPGMGHVVMSALPFVPATKRTSGKVA
jgi:hypothetical protein